MHGTDAGSNGGSFRFRWPRLRFVVTMRRGRDARSQSRKEETMRAAPSVGWVDRLDERCVAGWAYRPVDPHVPVLVEVRKAGRFVATVRAARVREDVRMAEESNGRCGFVFVFEPPLHRFEADEVEVFVVGDAEPLPRAHTIHIEPRPVDGPNCFIVGAPKCATTSMFHYLRQHPDVFVPRIKEPNFFAPDLQIAAQPEIDSLGAYRALYEHGVGARVSVDGSQFHLYSEKAPAAIRNVAPEAKIIIMLREPVSFMRSLHAQYVSTKDEDVADFREVVGRCAARSLGRQLPARTLFPKCMDYVALARFDAHVARYIEAFGQERVMIVLLDDLRADTRRVVLEVYRFLGLDERFAPGLGPKNVRASSQRSAPSASDAELDRSLRVELRASVRQLSRILKRDLTAVWHGYGE